MRKRHTPADIELIRRALQAARAKVRECAAELAAMLGGDRAV